MPHFNEDSISIANAFWVRSSGLEHLGASLSLWVEVELYKMLTRDGADPFAITATYWKWNGNEMLREELTFRLHEHDGRVVVSDRLHRKSMGAYGKEWYFLSYKLVPHSGPMPRGHYPGLSIAIPEVKQGDRVVIKAQHMGLLNHEFFASCLIDSVRGISGVEHCGVRHCDCEGDRPCPSHVVAIMELMQHGLETGDADAIILARDKWDLLCPDCRRC